MRLLSSILVLFWGVATLHAAGTPQTRNHRSASLAFLRLPARSHTLDDQEVVLTYSLVVANEFRIVGPIDEDAETWRLGFGYRKGFGRGLEVFAEVPFLSRGGGAMDPVIDWWHTSVLGDPNPLRDSSASGRAHIEFPGASSFGSAIGFGDVSVGVAQQVDDRTVAGFAIKLPTGNPSMLTGSGAFDIGASMQHRAPLARRLFLDLNGGYVVQGRSPRIGDARKSVYSSSIAIEWERNTRDSWTIAWNTEQSPTKTGNAVLDGDHRTVSVEYSRRTSDHTAIKAFFAEDGDFRWFRFPGGATVGPDFTFGVQVSQYIKNSSRR